MRIGRDGGWVSFGFNCLHGHAADLWTDPLSPEQTPAVARAGGIVIGAIPFAADHAYEFVFGLGERERVIDGERYLTLTGLGSKGLRSGSVSQERRWQCWNWATRTSRTKRSNS